MSFEEEYFDVLKAIETAIVRAYSANPALKDVQADKALNGLVRYYNAAIKSKKPPILKLKQAEQALYEAVKLALEAHMSGDGLFEPTRMVTVEEAVVCLKRILRSIEQYSKMQGSGGNAYLEFVKSYQRGGE